MQNENQADQEMKVNGEAPAAEAPAAEEIKETHVFVAPRQAGKLKIKKGPSFEAKEIQKQLEGVKLWSTRVLASQLTSKVISQDLRKAIEEELEKRK